MSEDALVPLSVQLLEARVGTLEEKLDLVTARMEVLAMTCRHLAEHDIELAQAIDRLADRVQHAVLRLALPVADGRQDVAPATSGHTRNPEPRERTEVFPASGPSRAREFQSQIDDVIARVAPHFVR